MTYKNGYIGSWPLPVRDQVLLALVSGLIIATRIAIRPPIRIPGHSGLLWMGLILVGIGVVRRPGAGTMIGIVTGLLATVMYPGRLGIFVGVRYLIPGIVADLLFALFGGQLNRAWVAMIIAASANMAKLAVNYFVGLTLGIPAGFLAAGLGVASTTHLVFGALGGLAASAVLNHLQSTGALSRLWPMKGEEMAS